MSARLRVSIGQHSDKGRKQTNQDFHGAHVPSEPQLTSKGVCVGLADGISTSPVSQIASESAVRSFLTDYYLTSDAWSVRSSAERVLRATNSWLYSQTQNGEARYEKDRGYVCTFSGLVLKSATAHVFHAGDTRIYQLRGERLQQLTRDHRLRISDELSYLNRALGVGPELDIDYEAIPLERDALFLLVTDGVYEHLDDAGAAAIIRENAGDLDAAARALVSAAYENGSSDNLTAQLVRVEELADPSPSEILQGLLELPFPPPLEPGMHFEGYRIGREIHASHRSHVYFAVDEASGAQVAIKVPSAELREDAAHVERFLMEEWVARRLSGPHTLKACSSTRPRSFVYQVTEYVAGQTLAQWMNDHPRPDVETVRGLVEQIARGLQTFHRQEMLHQDLRPENILIDGDGTLKLIDFGSARVAGIAELALPGRQPAILGTVQYTAPEYFLGEAGSARSDQFSLGVISYQLLSGRLPYGARVPQSRTRDAQRRLVYASVLDEKREIPAWVDDAIKRAVHPDPDKRYQELSEFVYDLRRPSQAFLNKTRPPLLERNPAAFWKWTSFILSLVIAWLLARH
jgi:serine/threonine protein phosphatase PrpC/predicted Ser/Thr protein kinase